MQFGVSQNEKFDHSNILFTFCCNVTSLTYFCILGTKELFDVC